MLSNQVKNKPTWILDASLNSNGQPVVGILSKRIGGQRAERIASPWQQDATDHCVPGEQVVDVQVRVNPKNGKHQDIEE